MRIADDVAAATAVVSRIACRLVLIAAVAGRAAFAQTAQAPSPMVETTRRHERLAPRVLDGAADTIQFAGRAHLLRHPARRGRGGAVELVVHFHGVSWLPAQAVAEVRPSAAVLVVNLGAGSSAYARPFDDPAGFDTLLSAVARQLGAGRPIGALTITSFSAGYGAVRALLREPRHAARIRALLLLDGLHASYLPDATPLAAGGAVDSSALAPFRAFAQAAAAGRTRFVVTHSEIFPGSYASTTETADWLLNQLGLRRRAVLRWGPVGMQQLSEARRGSFELRGYAGNSAPDHVDHLHALPELLRRLW